MQAFGRVASREEQEAQEAQEEEPRAEVVSLPLVIVPMVADLEVSRAPKWQVAQVER